MGTVDTAHPPTQIEGFGRPHQVTVDEADVQVVNFWAFDLLEALLCATELVAAVDRPVRGVEAQEYQSRDGRWTHRVVLEWDRRREVRS